MSLNTDGNVNPLAEILEEEKPPAPPPKPRPNRTFTLLIVVLILLMTAGLVFLFFVAPRLAPDPLSIEQTRAMRYAENTATVAAATAQAEAMMQALTPSITVTPTRTIAPTNTPLLAQPSATATNYLSTEQVQTLAAMQTQVAGTQTAVAIATESGELPATGGMSQMGTIILVSSLAGVAALLIALIFILRAVRARMRTR